MFWLGRAGMTLLGRRVFALRALPVADKCLAQFVLLSLVLGVRAAVHTECFANAVHGAMKGKLTCELCRGERNDSISHLGEYGLSFRICALALGLVVKTALIFDAEFSALISNKSVDFERSSFGAMPKTLRDFERFVRSVPEYTVTAVDIHLPGVLPLPGAVQPEAVRTDYGRDEAAVQGSGCFDPVYLFRHCRDHPRRTELHRPRAV